MQATISYPLSQITAVFVVQHLAKTNHLGAMRDEKKIRKKLLLIVYNMDNNKRSNVKAKTIIYT